MELPLRNRRGDVVAMAMVDERDYEWVNQWRWYLSNGYARRSGPRRNGRQEYIYLHRLILGLEVGDPREGDHRNRNRLDNHRSNLRVTTHAGNLRNMPSRRGSTSRFRGVCWDAKRRKWRAYSRTSTGRWIELGRFENEEKAGQVAAAYREQQMPDACDGHQN